ncbi:MAG: hypothetical protein AB1489_32320 [Acidobacteriota bacterium]
MFTLQLFFKGLCIFVPDDFPGEENLINVLMVKNALHTAKLIVDQGTVLQTPLITQCAEIRERAPYPSEIALTNNNLEILSPQIGRLNTSVDFYSLIASFSSFPGRFNFPPYPFKNIYPNGMNVKEDTLNYRIPPNDAQLYARIKLTTGSVSTYGKVGNFTFVRFNEKKNDTHPVLASNVPLIDGVVCRIMFASDKLEIASATWPNPLVIAPDEKTNEIELTISNIDNKKSVVLNEPDKDFIFVYEIASEIPDDIILAPLVSYSNRSIPSAMACGSAIYNPQS